MRTTLLALLTVAPACATDSLNEAMGALDNAVVEEQMLCDQRACFLHRAADRDRDGIADLDEEKIGTDPDRFYSRPRLAEVFRVLPDLPTFQAGSSMLVMLPTFTPFGEEVFGGKDLLPAKRSLLDEMGIELPENGSIDLSDGFTLTRALYDGQGLAFSVPPWLAPQPSAPDTTTLDAGGASVVVGEVMKGHGPQGNFKIQSASTSGDYSFAQFSYTTANNFDWTVTVQSSSNHATATATMQHTNMYGSVDHGKVVTSTWSKDEYGTERTTSSTTQYTGEDGKLHEKTVTQTEATSDDGDAKYWSTETREDGKVVASESGGSIDGEPLGPTGGGTTVEDEIEEPGTANMDPDYIEWTASPEVMDAAMVLHQGPVQTVNPLDADEQVLQFTAAGVNGNDTGPVVLYSPDVYDTAITEPVIVHMPFQEDREEGPSEEAPAPDDGYQGGQCVYCNQGGGE